MRVRARRLGVATATGLMLVGTVGAVPAYALPVSASETPGGAAGARAEAPGKPAKPAKPEPDTEPPAVPVLAEATVGPEGSVELPVTAEAAAQVIVREDGAAVVAEAKATGAPQVLRWETTDGTHTYSVTATDKDDNESAAATVTVDVDATPPPVKRFTTKPGTATDTSSMITFATEAETGYQLRVDDEVVAEGTTDGTAVEASLDLADGRHQVQLELTDEVGNVRTATRSLKVRIPRLQVRAQLASEVTDAVQVITVTAPAGARGVLEVPGERDQRFRLEKGAAELEVALGDGTYETLTVIVRDTQGRTGSAELTDVIVDTTAPELVVALDEAAATEGKLSAAVTAEESSVVAWRLLDRDGVVAATGKYVAQGGEQSIEQDVAEGGYELEVSATDTYERTTEERVAVRIAADPMASSTLVLAGVGLVVLLGGLLTALVRWRRRRRAAAIDERPARRRQSRKQLAREAASEEDRLAAYQRAEESWLRRQAALTRLLGVARGDVPEDAVAEVELLPDERVLYTTGARLTETVQGNVALEVEPGQLVVTNQRFAFVGTQHQRDWWYALVERVRHVDHEHTTIKLWDSETASGFAYDDSEVTRLYLDLGLSTQKGTQATYLAGVTQGLRDHEMRRPTPPSATV